MVMSTNENGHKLHDRIRSRNRNWLSLKAIVLVIVVLTVLQMMHSTMNDLTMQQSHKHSHKAILKSMFDLPLSSPKISSVFESFWFLMHTSDSSNPNTLLSDQRFLRIVKPSIMPEKCQIFSNKSHESAPLLLNVRTRTAVYYDGGQWFHMAENLFAQYALLKQMQRRLDSSVVIFNFDQADFHKSLNPFTRLVTMISTSKPGATARTVHFMSNPILSHQFAVQEGESFLLTRDMLGNAETLSFRHHVAHDSTHNTNNKSTLHHPVAHHNNNPNTNINNNVINADNSRLLSIEEVNTANRFRNIHSLTSGASLDAISSSPTTSSSSQSNVDQEHCVRFVGSIGGSLVKRGEWFPQSDDLQDFRSLIAEFCPRNESLIESTRRKRKYKLVAYQRDQTRRIVNLPTALHQIKSGLADESDWDISVVVHDNERSPCELAHLLHDVDVLLTPHGFQSMLQIFLPSPSLIFEVFPARYFKQVYRVLSHEFGLVHGHVHSPPVTFTGKLIASLLSTSQCLSYYPCRSLARSDELLLTSSGVGQLLALIHQHKSEFQSIPQYNNNSNDKDNNDRKFLPKHRIKLYS